MKTYAKATLRKIITALPGGKEILKVRLYLFYLRIYLREYFRLAKIGNAKEIFYHHYAVNEWGNLESISGDGSTMQYTENIREEIPKLVQDLGVKVIIDAPCGDYNWFRMIDWEDEITYIGGDIVKPLIEHNQSLYGSKNRQFLNLDIIHDDMPKAGLWLCRDCLFHLSNRNIMLVIDNFLRSDIRYLLTSTHPHLDKNYDIPTGSFRCLNLQIPPYSFGEPITHIDDWIEGFPVRHLALWEREALRETLASNKPFQRTAKHRKK